MKKISLTILIIALLFVFLTIGCSSPSLVATVNGEDITEKDLEMNIDFMTSQDATGMLAQDEERLDAARSDILDSLIIMRLVRQHAEGLDIEVLEEEVEQMYVRIVDSFDTEAQLEEALAERGITQEFLKRELKNQVIGDKVLEYITEDIEVTEEQAREFYEANKGRMFVEAEKVKVSHILAKFSDEEERHKAIEKIEFAFSQIGEGKPFEEVAKELSDDEDSSQNGGDIGYIRKARFPDSFKQAAFELEIGELSEIIETESGFHILTVTDREKEHLKEFELVKDVAAAYVEDQQSKQAWTDLIFHLIDEAEIVFHTDIKGTMVTADQG